MPTTKPKTLAERIDDLFERDCDPLADAADALELLEEAKEALAAGAELRTVLDGYIDGDSCRCEEWADADPGQSGKCDHCQAIPACEAWDRAVR